MIFVAVWQCRAQHDTAQRHLLSTQAQRGAQSGAHPHCHGSTCHGLMGVDMDRRV
jgi:hypothetical protein